MDGDRREREQSVLEEPGLTVSCRVGMLSRQWPQRAVLCLPTKPNLQYTGGRSQLGVACQMKRVGVAIVERDSLKVLQ